MVSTKILELVNKIVLSYFEGWENIDLLISVTAFETVKDIFAFLFYILPMDGIMTIVEIFVSLMVFRITISLIKTLWQLLPIL